MNHMRTNDGVVVMEGVYCAVYDSYEDYIQHPQPTRVRMTLVSSPYSDQAFAFADPLQRYVQGAALLGTNLCDRETIDSWVP